MQINQPTPVNVNSALGFIEFTDPFASFENRKASQTSPAERLYHLMKSGSFAIGSEEIRTLIIGSITGGSAASVRAKLIRLCLEIGMLSYRSGDPEKVIAVWFDACTQMLHLKTAAGMSDRMSFRNVVAVSRAA
ncbi:MAG: hypothetical protein IT342_08125 [Candidatus Melainabacteria bacterium]|nr:hypothetical protein [Candidatus Melainabacteria bacterium]